MLFVVVFALLTRKFSGLCAHERKRCHDLYLYIYHFHGIHSFAWWYFCLRTTQFWFKTRSNTNPVSICSTFNVRFPGRSKKNEWVINNLRLLLKHLLFKNRDLLLNVDFFPKNFSWEFIIHFIQNTGSSEDVSFTINELY